MGIPICGSPPPQSSPVKGEEEFTRSPVIGEEEFTRSLIQEEIMVKVTSCSKLFFPPSGGKKDWGADDQRYPYVVSVGRVPVLDRKELNTHFPLDGGKRDWGWVFRDAHMSFLPLAGERQNEGVTKFEHNSTA